MSGVCRHVDALFLYIGVAPFSVHSHPVLQGEDAQDGVAVKMVAYHLLAKFRSGNGRCSAVMSQHGVVVPLRLLEIFFPPAAQRRHIMRRDGANRAVRIPVRMSEFL